jgi:hypothetical protein
VNILIIGDSKPANGSDSLFDMMQEIGHNCVLLHGYRKPNLNIKSNKLSLINPIGQIKNTINQMSIDIIYIRGDWFDEVILNYSQAIVSANYNVPVVVGYHCHTALTTEVESSLFTLGDGYILINEYAKKYFEELYKLQEKPISVIPSLFLPNSEFYKKQVNTKYEKKTQKSEYHCVIVSGVIRISGLPKKLIRNEIHHENYIYDRYDYYQICKYLAANEIHVHLYGKYYAQQGLNVSNVKFVYEKLQAEFPEYIHYEGYYSGIDFVDEISRYDFTIMNGMLPDQLTPPFEHMNYQVRMNPILAARLPIFVARNTYSYLEDLITEKEIGLVFENINDIKRTLSDSKRMASFSKNISNVQMEHSNEYWVSEYISLFDKVIAGFESFTKPQSDLYFITILKIFRYYSRNIYKKISSIF